MTNSYQYKRLNKDDAVLLLIDHQVGFISLVRDYTKQSWWSTSLKTVLFSYLFEAMGSSPKGLAISFPSEQEIVIKNINHNHANLNKNCK